MPPAFWRGIAHDPECLLIGTNRVLCFEALQGAPWHALLIRDHYRDLWHDQKWGCRYHNELWKGHPAWRVGSATDRGPHCDEFVRPAPGWQAARVPDANNEAAVMKNPSVVLMAANWAWLQGVREIFLIGVDYRGGHTRMIRPYEGVPTGWAGRY
ncbi:hypothetical protein LCGC14_1934630, partial [marine sediment metagenome]